MERILYAETARKSLCVTIRHFPHRDETSLYPRFYHTFRRTRMKDRSAPCRRKHSPRTFLEGVYKILTPFRNMSLNFTKGNTFYLFAYL